jgi:hypothetical protein
MDDQQIKIDLVRIYLEIARSCFNMSPKDMKGVSIGDLSQNDRGSIVIALSSVTILYSDLAVEAFCNFQFWKVWSGDYGSEPEKRLSALIGNESKFENLKKQKLIRELGKRLKTLCNLLGLKPVHDVDQTLWNDFKKLVEETRHFLTHPVPDRESITEHLDDTLMLTKSGKYAETATRIIKHFYTEMKMPMPKWLDTNTLFRFAGVDYLVGSTDLKVSQ